MKFAKYLNNHNVVLHLKGRTRDEVINELVDHICRGPDDGKEDILNSIYTVEDIKNTAVGHGIAIPHGRTDVVPQIKMALGISEGGVNWGSPDGQPVKIVWLIVNPRRLANEYLSVLSEVTKVSHRRNSREAILKAKDAAEIIEMVRQSRSRMKPRP